MDDHGIGIYTNPVISTQPVSPRSTGSFGPVFTVLAVITVISAAACVLGRLCSRRLRLHRAKEAAAKPPHKASKQKPELGPKEWQKPNFSMRDGDVEFGFDKKISSGEGPKNGVRKGKGDPPKSYHGGKKTGVRFADAR